MYQDKDTQSPPAYDSLAIFPSPDPDVDLHEEFDRVKALLDQTTSDNDWTYLIPSRWLERWKEYGATIKKGVSDAVPPGRIDTSDLLTSDGVLKPDLYAPRHFRTAPRNVWEILVKRYGVHPSEIPHRMVQSFSGGKHKVGIYPVEHTIYLVCDNEDSKVPSRPPPKISVYQWSMVSDLKAAVERALHIPSHIPYSLWAMSDTVDKDKAYVPRTVLNTSNRLDLEDDDKMVALLGIYGADLAVDLNSTSLGISSSPLETTSDAVKTNSDMLMSTPSAYDLKQEQSQELDFNLGGLDEELSRVSSERKPIMVKEKSADYEPGYCGLENMGNTCYMNSALQCLSNTFELTRYFLDECYLDELNKDNPLGMKGELAIAYGELIRNMWSGRKPSFKPQKFKLTISCFNPAFIGSRQHDSQELLSFLLDGLHEDLNRIKKKPYVELPDFDDKPDNEVAEVCWHYHKARNDSIVVDLFQGQFKSRLVCSECGKISIMFDPFIYLSLSLPVQKTINLKVIFVPYTPEARQRRIVLSFKDIASIEQVKAQVAEKMGIDDPSTLLVLEIFDRSIYKIFLNYELINNEMNSDLIYVYQLPAPVPSPTGHPKKFKRHHGSSSFGDEVEDNNPSLIVFPVYFGTLTEDNEGGNALKQFGLPILLGMTPEDASDPAMIYKHIVRHIERFTSLRLVEEVNATTTTTEVSTTSEDMDVDDTTVENDVVQDEPVQRSVHTSAAVTAAGGRPVQPMSNLFVMKVFSDEGLLPTRSPFLLDERHLYDLTESRVNRGWKSPQSPLPPLPLYSSFENGSADTTPTTPMDEQDISEETGNCHSSPAASPPAPSPSSRSSPRQQQKQPLIKQGEGIVTVWTGKRAQSVFGGSFSDKSRAFDEVDEDPDVMDTLLKEKQQKNQDAEKKALTLYDCLKEFVREEVLGQDDMWYCPRCKKHRNAKKKIDLWFMPETLVVHLKRFSNSRVLRDKVDVFVDFPIDSLDLTDIVASCVEDRKRLLGGCDRMEEEQVIYDLYAVDNHYGGMGGGHYTAYAQNPKTKQWLKFNDDNVSPVAKRDNIKTNAAYLLFYKRRHTAITSTSSAPSSPQDILTEEQVGGKAEFAASKAEGEIVC